MRIWLLPDREKQERVALVNERSRKKRQHREGEGQCYLLKKDKAGAAAYQEPRLWKART